MLQGMRITWVAHFQLILVLTSLWPCHSFCMTLQGAWCSTNTSYFARNCCHILIVFIDCLRYMLSSLFSFSKWKQLLFQCKMMNILRYQAKSSIQRVYEYCFLCTTPEANVMPWLRLVLIALDHLCGWGWRWGHPMFDGHLRFGTKFAIEDCMLYYDETNA